MTFVLYSLGSNYKEKFDSFYFISCSYFVLNSDKFCFSTDHDKLFREYGTQVRNVAIHRLPDDETDTQTQERRDLEPG